MEGTRIKDRPARSERPLPMRYPADVHQLYPPHASRHLCAQHALSSPGWWLRRVTEMVCGRRLSVFKDENARPIEKTRESKITMYVDEAATS